MWTCKEINLLIVALPLFLPVASTAFRLGADAEGSAPWNSTIHPQLKLFGQPCNTTQDCQLSFLCRNNICSCPDSRIPRPQKGFFWSSGVTCDIPAGGNCGPVLYRDIKTFGASFWTKLGLGQGREREDSQECVPNAKCDMKKCSCIQGFYKDLTGHCTPQRTIFQRCSKEDEECQDSLVCNGSRGRCECSGQYRFSIETLKCHIPAGGVCDDFSSQDKCIPSSDCIENICVCKFGYRRGKDGTCALDHGLPCDQDYSCADLDLVCRSGRCVCKYWAHQYYDEDAEECVGKVSSPCDLVADTGDPSLPSFKMLRKCTEQAECRQTPQGPECQCTDTYAEDKDGRCSKSLGARCQLDSECDAVGQLVCVNGKCNCPDELQTFHLESRRCRGLVGSRCTTNTSLIHTFREQGISTNCIGNAFCEIKVEGLDGRCTCNFGYEANLMRTCDRRSSKFMYGWDTGSEDSGSGSIKKSKFKDKLNNTKSN